MSQPPSDNGLSYRDAGVDIDSGNRLVDRIKPLARATARPEVIGGIGGFGALMRVPLERYKNPVLVSGTDGVGTKLRLAIDHNRHHGVGIDLVAMCVNDILTLGAEPFLFLDYLATGKLDEDVAATVIAGIADGCKQAGAALVGGETAEMPGMYTLGDYDIAGFSVGLVDREAIIDGSTILAGDVLLGIASNGPHSNGFSLIRKVLEVSGAKPHDITLDDGKNLLDALLEPTHIYKENLSELAGSAAPKGLSHITGGGLTGNIPRMLPEGLGVRLDTASWAMPAVFGWLQAQGGISIGELRRTFNCGIGMVACVAPAEKEQALRALQSSGVEAWRIGEVIDDPAAMVHYDG